jgi:hypothetical protein
MDDQRSARAAVSCRKRVASLHSLGSEGGLPKIILEICKVIAAPLSQRFPNPFACAGVAPGGDPRIQYGADHRRPFAKLLAAKFTSCQLVVVTYDERFFWYLKELLAPADWHFTRITGAAPAHGPRFADDMVSDDMIEARWTAGLSAANEMRQAEEEWLLARCREFGVNVRIRPLERRYSYERSELASALAGYLRGPGLLSIWISWFRTPALRPICHHPA